MANVDSRSAAVLPLKPVKRVIAVSESEIRELFEQLRSVKDELKGWGEHHRRAENVVHSIDLRLTRIEEMMYVANEGRRDHEKRVRAVERWAYGIPPAIILALVALLERLWN